MTSAAPTAAPTRSGGGRYSRSRYRVHSDKSWTRGPSCRNSAKRAMVTEEPNEWLAIGRGRLSEICAANGVTDTASATAAARLANGFIPTRSECPALPPNELRVSCGATLECSQTDGLHRRAA